MALSATFLFFKNIMKGGFGFLKFVRKFNKFIERVDVIVDDFFPDILGALEKKNLVALGTSARWTSAQARILKAQSPIEITSLGNQILNEINFSKTYADNLAEIKKRILENLSVQSSEYELEQASLQVAIAMFDENDEFSRGSKSYLFTHPKMSASDIKSLIGIYMRNELRKDVDVMARLKLQ